MNARSLHRLTERVRSTAGWGALMIGCKSIAFFAIHRLDAAMAGPATTAAGVLLAGLAAVAVVTWVCLEGKPGLWGYTLAAVLSLDLLLTLGVLGVPAVHPALQVSLVVFVYGGAAFLCTAAWCGAAVLQRSGYVPVRTRRRRPRPRRRARRAA